MTFKKKSWLDRLFKIEERAGTDLHRINMVHAFLTLCLLTIVVSMSVLILGIIDNRMMPVYTQIATQVVLIVHIVYLVKTLDYKNAGTSAFFWFALLLLWAQAVGDERYAILFNYGFPVAAVFIIGYRRGVILSALHFLLLLSLILYRYSTNPETFYTIPFIVRFIISYIPVLGFSFVIERLREKAQGELASANEQLRVLSLQDGLTKLYNRRFFESALDREVGNCRRKRIPFALIMLDIDHFKSLNDNFGHPAGDRALVRVAEALKKSATRASDVCIRYGGEEFAVLLHDTTLEGALKVAAVIQQNIAYLKIENEPYGPLTLSMGIAQYDCKAQPEASDLIKAADDALYQSKHEGRNRITLAKTES